MMSVAMVLMSLVLLALVVSRRQSCFRAMMSVASHITKLESRLISCPGLLDAMLFSLGAQGDGDEQHR